MARRIELPSRPSAILRNFNAEKECAGGATPGTSA
jgi:hypothetical protein